MGPGSDDPARWAAARGELAVAIAASAPLIVQIDTLRACLGVDGLVPADDGSLSGEDQQRLLAALRASALVKPVASVATSLDGIVDVAGASSPAVDGPRFLVDLAKTCSAIRMHRGRLVPTKSWEKQKPIRRVEHVLRKVIDRLMLLEGRPGQPQVQWFDSFVLDGMCSTVFALLLDTEIMRYDELADYTQGVATQLVGDCPPVHPAERRATVASVLHGLFDMMRRLAIVRPLTPDPPPRPGVSDDYVTLTHLGRELATGHLPWHGTGRGFRRDGHVDVEALFQFVQPYSDYDLYYDDQYDDDEEFAEPWDHGAITAASADAGGYFSVSEAIDTLARLLPDARAVAATFIARTYVTGVDRLLGEMWRHDAPETEAVLDALATHVDDPDIAKQARKSLFRHRTWLANRTS